MIESIEGCDTLAPLSTLRSQISGGSEKVESQKFELAVQQPAEIQNAQLTLLEANTFPNLSTYISLITWTTQQSTDLLKVFPGEIENLISGEH